MAWLTGWSYRKEITITGQSGAGTDFQVDLDIGDSTGGDFHLEGHCTNFPQDIAVTDNDGSTPIDYWIEDITADPLKVWVEVADDLGSNQTIYIYYGKSGATTDSNGNDTFEFFDDFTPGTETWTEVDPNSHIVIDRATDERIEVTDLARNEDAYVHQALSIDSLVISGKVSVTSANTGQLVGLFGISDTINDTKAWQNGAQIYFYWSGDVHQLSVHGFSGNSRTADGWTSAAINTNYWVDMYIDSTTVTAKIYSEVGRTNLLDTISTTIGNVLYSQIYAVCSYNSNDSSAGSGIVDDIYVRKYNSPEPAFSSAGSEETNVSTNLFDGKIRIKNVTTNLLDGKVRIKSVTTNLLDGKVSVQNMSTDLLDGKIRIKGVGTDLLDGKVRIKDVGTDLLDGKIQIKSVTTNLLDGKVSVQNVTTNLFDGKILIEDDITDLLDGKVRIKDVGTDLLDGKVIITSGGGWTGIINDIINPTEINGVQTVNIIKVNELT